MLKSELIRVAHGFANLNKNSVLHITRYKKGAYLNLFLAKNTTCVQNVFAEFEDDKNGKLFETIYSQR